MSDIQPPTSAEIPISEALQYAVSLQQAEQYADAEAVYRRVLEVAPEQADTLNFLGVLMFQTGRPEESVDLLERAVEFAPESADAHNNLGNIYRAIGRIDEAFNAYEKAVKLAPTNVDILLNYAHILESRRQIDRALEQYDRVFGLNEKISIAYRRAGRLMRHFGTREQAEAVYQRWLTKEPENPVAKHLLAASRGEVPDRAADDYVQATFDGFAASFDEALAGLEYCAPQRIAELLPAAFGSPQGNLEILDAGCGTGLCADSLRPYARRLVGVDLSQGMLRQAEQRGAYDELVQAELTAFMLARPQLFDLVASADTLIYFGNLQPVFAAFATTLRTGGRFAFTVEHATGDPHGGIVLNSHGRYSHTESYVREHLAAAGLQIRSLSTTVLRKEVSEPVAGLVVLAER